MIVINANDLFKERIRGEAYGLRALHMYYLLRSHAGLSDAGELLGVPIVLDPEGVNSDFNYPRNTFEECMQQFL